MITGTGRYGYHFDSQKTLHDLRNFVVVSKDDPTADYHRTFAFSLTRWIVSHPFSSFICRLFITESVLNNSVLSLGEVAAVPAPGFGRQASGVLRAREGITREGKE